jgi:pescadillo
MGREQKKGKAGNARAYITRAKALKKLQLSLPEFRRLCILKGIFPRDPKKKVEGADKTYYLRKDIDFLAHERIIGSWTFCAL